MLGLGLFDFKTVLGKLLCIVLIIVATHYHVLAGVLVVLVVISMGQSVIEGMNTGVHNSSKDSTDSTDSTESTISLFKKNNCKDGKLMKDGKPISNDLIKDSFPNIKFSGDTCNPCDNDCQFEIVSSAERLTTEKNLESVDSNTIPVNREQSIKKQ